MPGQEHAGLAGQLPAGGLPKDERCQAPSRFQLSTGQRRRLLGAGSQHRADPGEPTGSEDSQHAPLRRGRAKRLLPVAKQGFVVTDLTRTRPVWSRHEAQQAETPHPAEPPAPAATQGRRRSSDPCSCGKGSKRGRHPAVLPGSVLLRGAIPRWREPLGRGRGPARCWSG